MAYMSWTPCHGEMNVKGQRLLVLCCHHGLTITNVFFENKPCHKVSWIHPRSGHWHQLDLVITRRDAVNNVLNTRSYSYQSADCDTDHSLICAMVRMQPKRLFRSKQKGHIRINIGNNTYPEKNQQFIESIRTALSGIESEEENWNTIRDIIHDTALTTYGKKQRKNTD